MKEITLYRLCEAMNKNDEWETDLYIDAMNKINDLLESKYAYPLKK